MKYIVLVLFAVLIAGCASSKKNSKITVTGIAENVKAGAIVITDDSVFYYVDGLYYWDENTGRRVTVTGELDVIKLAAVKAEDNDIIRQDFNRERNIVLYYLRKPKWKFISAP